eukprot:m.59321 g.59321  ORF g.59321 m.59321 type:complete len:264 (+) comp22689_c0_seq2:259-1050(+)
MEEDTNPPVSDDELEEDEFDEDQSEEQKDIDARSHFLVSNVMSSAENRINRILSAGRSRASSARATSAIAPYSEDEDQSSWLLVHRVIQKVLGSWEIDTQWKYCMNRLGKLETRYLYEIIFSKPTRRRPIPNATASVLFSVDPGEDGFSSLGLLDDIDSSPFKMNIQPPPDGASIEQAAELMVQQVVMDTSSLIDSLIDDASRPSSINLSRLKGIDIVWCIETQDLVHDAKTSEFKDQWLKDVIAAKRSQSAIADEVLGKFEN